MTSNWAKVKLQDCAAEEKGAFVDGPFGSNLKATEYTSAGVPIIRLQNIGIGRFQNKDIKFVSEKKAKQLHKHIALPGDLVIAKMAEPVARACLVPKVPPQWVIVADCMRLRPNGNIVDPVFLVNLINSKSVRSESERRSTGTTRKRINLGKMRSIEILLPPLIEQKKIAEILTSVDEAIESTKKVIEQTKKVKKGLLQELMTKGIGHKKFKKTEIGEIPEGWEVMTIGESVISATDGPFGSNLKTEHYVDYEAIRVVRLKNLGDGKFNDQERVYVSERHAETLHKFKVVAGDVLVASLGDVTNPVGRACRYPKGAPAAIVKADCFRLRANEALLSNLFLELAINLTNTRVRIQSLAQGATRDRVNLKTLKSVRIPIPKIREQNKITATYLSIGAEEGERTLEKLRRIKSGLMQDLLTGKVRVKTGGKP